MLTSAQEVLGPLRISAQPVLTDQELESLSGALVPHSSLVAAEAEPDKDMGKHAAITATAGNARMILLLNVPPGVKGVLCTADASTRSKHTVDKQSLDKR